MLHKEEKRRYLVYTPTWYDSQPQKSFPVVFDFHGGGMGKTTRDIGDANEVIGQFFGKHHR